MMSLHVIAYGHANANETFRAEGIFDDVITKLIQYRVDSYDAVRNIEHSLLTNGLGENGGLGDIKL